MSLFGLLGTTARSLDAQRFGLDVVGNNLANVNTPGYTRRVAELGAVPPVDRYSAGNGAEVLGVRALRDRLYDQRLFDELPLEQQHAGLAEALSLAEVALGEPGLSIDSALADFFDAMADLADAPSSVIARQQVVGEAQALAGAFVDLSARLTDAGRATDQRVRADVDEINTLVARIASLNESIAKVSANEALHLRDEQIAAVSRLSELIGTQVLELGDGSLQVSTLSGRPLAIGADAYPLRVESAPPQGYARIMSGTTDITSQISSGHLGGLLHARDTDIPAYQAQLDELAYAVAMEVNAVHATGFTLSGTPGGAFFTAPAAVAGAAATLTVDASIVSDPSNIAAAGIPAAGDNGVARALADLRDGAFVSGATPGEAWTKLVYRVSRDVNRAEADRASRNEIVQQIQLLRDSVSGVSIDEEAAMMIRFQRAYEANARFFTVVDETIQTLLSLKR